MAADRRRRGTGGAADDVRPEHPRRRRHSERRAADRTGAPTSGWTAGTSGLASGSGRRPAWHHRARTWPCRLSRPGFGGAEAVVGWSDGSVTVLDPIAGSTSDTFASTPASNARFLRTFRTGGSRRVLCAPFRRGGQLLRPRPPEVGLHRPRAIRRRPRHVGNGTRRHRRRAADPPHRPEPRRAPGRRRLGRRPAASPLAHLPAAGSGLGRVQRRDRRCRRGCWGRRGDGRRIGGARARTTAPARSSGTATSRTGTAWRTTASRSSGCAGWTWSSAAGMRARCRCGTLQEPSTGSSTSGTPPRAGMRSRAGKRSSSVARMGILRLGPHPRLAAGYGRVGRWGSGRPPRARRVKRADREHGETPPSIYRCGSYRSPAADLGHSRTLDSVGVSCHPGSYGGDGVAARWRAGGQPPRAAGRVRRGVGRRRAAQQRSGRARRSGLVPGRGGGDVPVAGRGGG